jgi:hypothetical protein
MPEISTPGPRGGVRCKFQDAVLAISAQWEHTHPLDPEDRAERVPVPEESRRYSARDGRSEMGRSHIYITYPWCGTEVRAYTWSLAGSGKRCPCGVLHGYYGNSRAPKNTKSGGRGA